MVSLQPLDLPAPPVVLKELEIRGVLTYRRPEFAEAIQLLARRGDPAQAVITGTVALEQTEASFQALTEPGNEHLKVLIQP